MHVGYFVEALPKFVLREIEGLRAQGVRLSVFSVLKPPRDWPVGSPERDWPSHNEVIFPSTGDAARGAFHLLVSSGRLPKGVRRARELGVNPRKFLRSAYFAMEARRRGVTQLHGTFGTWPTEHCVLVSAMTGLPYSFTLHAYDLFVHDPQLARKAKYAAAIRTISSFNETYFRKHFPEVASRIKVIRLGVPILENPHQVTPSLQKSEPFRLLSVGGLVPKKGFDLLISAVEQLLDRGSNIQLTIVGDGPLRPDLEARIQASRWAGEFHLAGMVPNKAVQTLLRDSHAAVLACREGADGNMDGIPVFLMESMVAGIPVISTRVSGVPELIEDGRTGLLVEPEDAGALARAIDRLVSDGELRSRLVRGGAARIRSEYHLETQVRAFISFLEGVEGERSATA
jgi:colanic acid/amylovoran biosynthesis glycosyltransferase